MGRVRSRSEVSIAARAPPWEKPMQPSKGPWRDGVVSGGEGVGKGGGGGRTWVVR